eukprot:6277361-Pyramimonas_sp.AAC.1
MLGGLRAKILAGALPIVSGGVSCSENWPKAIALATGQHSIDLSGSHVKLETACDFHTAGCGCSSHTRACTDMLCHEEGERVEGLVPYLELDRLLVPRVVARHRLDRYVDGGA